MEPLDVLRACSSDQVVHLGLVAEHRAEQAAVLLDVVHVRGKLLLSMIQPVACLLLGPFYFHYK